MDPISLRTDGPHSPDYTRQVASTLAECVRVLNYATMAREDGLIHPADVDSVISAAYTATSRMPQLFTQLNNFLGRLRAAGSLVSSRGADPLERFATASYHLGRAAEHADNLTADLQQAQNAVAGLYRTDLPDD